MLVFATETSCDETSICLMKERKIIEHVIFSQEIHKNHGGVVPELASREHLKILQEISQKMFSRTNISLNEIDIFTATCGPGLIGSLLVGSTFTKSLALNLKKPFVPINHLEGHLLSTSFNNEISYPHLVFILTGGHTQIYLMISDTQVRLLGESVDDAIGEAFDKVAKLLGLGYPGGSELEKRAIHGDENFYKLPMPLANEDNLNFSFSGIKTHVNILASKNIIDDKFINNISASFQKTIFKILSLKIERALNMLNKTNIFTKSVSIVGGVANNNYIRTNLQNLFNKKKIGIYYPLKEMMSDNAAMIAWACIKNYNRKKK